MKKVLSVLGDILVAVILIVAVTMTVLVVTSVKSDAQVPNLFGYALLNVQTDSMESEDGFYVGDMIIVKMLTTEEIDHLKVGDVISFVRYINEVRLIETHRIVEDKYTSNQSEVVDGVWIHGGMHYYVTQGDNTDGIDRFVDSGEIDYADNTNIIGVWTGKSIPKLGAVMDFMKSQLGFMICIVLPVALFFIYELYVFVMTLTRRQKERTLQEVADKEAELKAKAVAEFLAQQQNGGESALPAEEAKPAAPPAEPADAPADKPAEPEEKPAEKSPDAISEEEKQRIIQEYLAKQQKPDGE